MHSEHEFPRADACTPQCLRPDWPAPPAVQALTTLRCGGHSEGPWRSFNLAMHTGDAPSAVQRNRSLLQQYFALPSPPVWLDQVHGRRILELHAPHEPLPASAVRADGSWTWVPHAVCAVMTADCLPVLMCDAAGSRVAAVHAGWKGLQQGIIAAAVDVLAVPPDELLVWLGPAIGPRKYEIGTDVYDAFLRDSDVYETAFRPTRAGHWLLDVYEIARIQLAGRHVGAVYGGTQCTYSDVQAFYSYRRDGQCGRMASLIWLDGAAS